MTQQNPNGFITLDRKILEWEWFKEPLTKHLFLYLLLTVNWEDKRDKGYLVPRGACMTTLPELAKGSYLSVQNVRTAINHLKSTGEITDKVTNKFRIITVTKYSEYQDPNRHSNRQLTDNQQTTNRQNTPHIRNARRTNKQEEQFNNNSPSENEHAQETKKPEKVSISDSLVAPPVPATPPTYGNKEINDMLLALKSKIGVSAFVDSNIERFMGKHCLDLLGKLGKEEFVRRLSYLLSDPFHQKNCNKIKYVYNNIKGFIEPKMQKGKTVFIS